VLPGPDTVHQDGDLLHLLVRTADVEAVAAALAAPPPGDD